MPLLPVTNSLPPPAPQPYDNILQVFAALLITSVCRDAQAVPSVPSTLVLETPPFSSLIFIARRKKQRSK